MNALLQAELLKLRTTRTFAAVVGAAALFSLLLVVLGASRRARTSTAHALFTNNSITYFIVLLGAIGMTGEWRHRTITGTVLAAPDRVRLLAAKVDRLLRRPASSSSLARDGRDDVAGTIALKARGEATLGVGGLADVLWRNLAVAALLGPARRLPSARSVATRSSPSSA